MVQHTAKKHICSRLISKVHHLCEPSEQIRGAKIRILHIATILFLFAWILNSIIKIQLTCGTMVREEHHFKGCAFHLGTLMRCSKIFQKKGASIHCAKFPPLLLFDTRNGRGSRVQFLLVSPVYHRSKYRNIILLVGALSQTASDWDLFTNVFLACLWCYRHFWFQYIHELICVNRFFTSWFVTFPSPLSSLHTRQIRSHCCRYCLGISLSAS